MMLEVQLDENLNSAKLISACKGGGLTRPFRLPHSVMGSDDPTVLRHSFGQGRALITTDQALPAEYVGEIPSRNPGIIVIGHSQNVQATITLDRIIAILERFKHELRDCLPLPCRNSIVLITESSIDVSHVAGGALHRDASFQYGPGDWRRDFKSILLANADDDALRPT